LVSLPIAHNAFKGTKSVDFVMSGGTVVVVLSASVKSRLAGRQPSVAAGCPGDNQAVHAPQVRIGGDRVMRIAVARTLADVQNAHFGYAEHFLVFELGDGEPVLLEVRDATGHCTGAGGDRRRLRSSVETVADCVAVLALRIGPCARRELDAAGVLAIEYPGPVLDGAQPLLAGLRRSRVVQNRTSDRTSSRTSGQTDSQTGSRTSGQTDSQTGSRTGSRTQATTKERSR
jgi:predicted Fe-Mo cluster-binding NifX family protein